MACTCEKVFILKVHCHAIRWFLRHFVVGTNNGGRASFQTKRAQQVCCLLIMVLYIVLCGKINTTAPERLRVLNMLNDCQTNTAQDRSVELCKPVLNSMNFHHCSGQTCLFVFTFLIISQTQLRQRDEWLCKGKLTTDWCSDVDRSRSSEQVKKKSAAKACDSLAGAAASSLLAAIFDRKKST